VSINEPFFSTPHGYDGPYMDKGKNAEALVMSWLREQPHVLRIHDYRDNGIMRRYDVDIGIDTTDGRTLLAEIKHDEHLGVSGNVLYETMRFNLQAPIDRAQVLGWTARTPAQLLYCYAPQVNSIYEFRLPALRHAMQRYLLDCKKQNKQPVVKWINTDPGVTTQNLLIPMSYCAHFCEIHLLKSASVGEIPF